MANLSSLRQPFAPENKCWQKASELRNKANIQLYDPLQLPLLKPLFPNGLTRGMLTEISGPRSSARTSLCLHVLAEATRQGEICAVVDAGGTFSSESAVSAGICLSRILWICCLGNAEHSMQATDLLLHAGGFGVIYLDLCEVPARVLNRIPISYWHRYRQAVKDTPTLLITCFDQPQAKSSFINRIEIKSEGFTWNQNSAFELWNESKVQVLVQPPSGRVSTKTLQVAI